MVSYLLFLHPCMPSSFYICLASGNTEGCTDSVALLATATGLQYLKHCGIQISSHYAAAGSAKDNPSFDLGEVYICSPITKQSNARSPGTGGDSSHSDKPGCLLADQQHRHTQSHNNCSLHHLTSQHKHLPYRCHRKYDPQHWPHPPLEQQLRQRIP